MDGRGRRTTPGITLLTAVTGQRGESGINGRGRNTTPGITLLTAVTGQRRESGINGRGRRTTHSRNWIVLLQRILTKPLS